MRKMKVAINGFGRIGRVLERINLKKDIFELIVINDINDDIKNLAYLLKYDSTYGRLDMDVSVISNDMLDINGARVKVTHEKEIQNVPWHDYQPDVIVDASGVKGNDAKLAPYEEHFKHFIVTTEPGVHMKSIVCGVNESELDIDQHRYISSSICDAAALTPVVKSLDSHFKISHGFLTTLHPWLSFQRLMDTPKIPGLNENDSFSLARSAVSSLIPKATSAVKASNFITPGIEDKIGAFSYRVPTATVSSAILDLTLTENVTVEAIHEKFNAFVDQQKYNAMHLNDEHLVSVDYSGFDATCIVDTRWTMVQNGNNVRIVYWYDNEWGYCARVIDLIAHISLKINQRDEIVVEKPVTI